MEPKMLSTIQQSSWTTICSLHTNQDTKKILGLRGQEEHLYGGQVRRKSGSFSKYLKDNTSNVTLNTANFISRLNSLRKVEL